ncbi:polysaccharide deacetylase family protein [Pseudomonas sp. RIT-PI-AD]|uniref:polysaccharide deacetylase family protein n=1 Tax=Pseudomonas sp. RIT-PI-AD TaxID=3035294 RepID=UPI0021DADEB3|nr:polysaccharide deacetylase family protein [Pseudomonas sp. RIT-PI-AD]
MVFATIDRSGWPERLDTPAGFDMASRAEILMFGKALLASEALDDAALKQRLGVKQVERSSVEAVSQRFWRRLLENYRLAAHDCAGAAFCPAVADLGALRQQAAGFTVAADSPYARWAEASRSFHETYLDEQLRLAALFPRISSEIERFQADEHNGDELPDRRFLLTFDDGPTAVGGQTDAVAALMRREGLHGMFFVLGGNLQARATKTSAQALGQVYEGQCVASHGWEHKSHAQWTDWQGSVTRTAALIRQTLGDDAYRPLFRPPYGQRRADAAPFFAAQGIRVSLWNIDSQDWSRAMGAEAAAQRVQTLMLLWRRGIVLFHDIHAKAAEAVPRLLAANRGNGVEWLDCHAYR